MPPVFKQHVFQPVTKRPTIIHAQQLSPRGLQLKRHGLWGNTTLLTKLMILFGAVLGLTLVAAATGFFICCVRQCYRRRERVRAHVDRAAKPVPKLNINSDEVTGFSEFDERQMQQMKQIMENNAFSGRELETLKAERKLKKKRALLVMDTSVATEMPIQIHYLRRKLKAESTLHIPLAQQPVLSFGSITAELHASCPTSPPRLPFLDETLNKHITSISGEDHQALQTYNTSTRSTGHPNEIYAQTRSVTCPAHFPDHVAGNELGSGVDGNDNLA